MKINCTVQEVEVRNGMKKKKKSKKNRRADDLASWAEKKKKLASPKNVGTERNPSIKSDPTCYTVTDSYIKITALPQSLPELPSIFSPSSSNNINSERANSFFHRLLSQQFFNGKNHKKRFCDALSPPFLAVPKEETCIQVDLNKKPKRNKTNDDKGTKELLNSVPKKAKKSIVPFCESEILISNPHHTDSTIQTVSYANFYEVLNENAFIFHLHHPCKFSFYGELKLTVFTGEIEILGYKLKATTIPKKVTAYSPKFCTCLVVETNPVSNNVLPKNGVDELTLRRNLEGLIPEKKIKEVFEGLMPNDAVVLVEQEISKFGSAISTYMELPLFPKDLENCSLMSESLKKLQSTFKFDSFFTKEEFRKSKAWENIKLKKCSVLCGGKGVGKSTLLRFYANRLLSKGEKVLVLDFDPGQPEFTAPGFVSAVVVDSPLLGPNFTHLTQGQMMVYYGGVNSSHSPSKYLECVNYIVQWCRNNPDTSQMKWLVNTMGFPKGLGVELMITLLKLISPDTVIQIKGSYEQNYPFDFTPELINSKKCFGNIPFQENPVTYDFWTISSLTQENNTKRSQLVSAELRDIMMISYFSGMLNSQHDRFNCVQPYVVSFSNIYLGINFYIRPNDILRAFNGNIVSLSHFEHTTETIFSEKSEEYCKIILKPRPQPSFGLGLVRGIDCVKKQFYILTPLPLDDLRAVNCLILGSIGPPDFMYLKQETVEMETVYTSMNEGPSTQKVKRIFRKLMKPSQ